MSMLFQLNQIEDFNIKKIIFIFVMLISKPFLIKNYNNSPENSVPPLKWIGYKPLFDGDVIFL